MNIDIFSGLAVLCSVAILTSTDSCRFDPMRFEPLPTASFDLEIKDGDQFRLDSHCHFGAPCEVRLNGVVLSEDMRLPRVGETYWACQNSVSLQVGDDIAEVLAQLSEPNRIERTKEALYLDYYPSLRIRVQDGKLRSFTVFGSFSGTNSTI